MSPVNATVHLASDAGIASPIYATLWRFPMTLVVSFDAPVDPRTFDPRLAGIDSCGYFDPGLDQDAQWLTDREARIDVRPPVPLAEYGVTFGRGRDPQGRELQEPQFQFIAMPGSHRPTIRLGEFELPAGPTRWTRSVEEDLDPISASPDGRYVLLARQRFANASDHSRIRIPYVLDLATGALSPYPRAAVWNVRWETERKAVWINGTTYLDLDRPGVSVDLLDRLPRDAGRVADARVSPDRRWLAAIVASTTDEVALEGDAELVVVDLRSGEVRSREKPFRFLRSPGGPYLEALSWSADSMALLVTSYLGFEERANGLGASAEYYVALVAGLTLRRLNGIGDAKGTGYADLSPGDHAAVPGHGIVRSDGTFALRDPTFWPTRIWSRDRRFAILTSEGVSDALDLATGARRRFGLTMDPSRPFSFLGLATDGSRLFLGDPYPR